DKMERIPAEVISETNIQSDEKALVISLVPPFLNRNLLNGNRFLFGLTGLYSTENGIDYSCEIMTNQFFKDESFGDLQFLEGKRFLTFLDIDCKAYYPLKYELISKVGPIPIGKRENKDFFINSKTDVSKKISIVGGVSKKYIRQTNFLLYNLNIDNNSFFEQSSYCIEIGGVLSYWSDYSYKISTEKYNFKGRINSRSEFFGSLLLGVLNPTNDFKDLDGNSIMIDKQRVGIYLGYRGWTSLSGFGTFYEVGIRSQPRSTIISNDEFYTTINNSIMKKVINSFQVNLGLSYGITYPKKYRKLPI
ncbi:MAG: hypothetical protein ACK46Y_16370, partial [Fluviicola sp.]